MSNTQLYDPKEIVGIRKPVQINFTKLEGFYEELEMEEREERSERSSRNRYHNNEGLERKIFVLKEKLAGEPDFCKRAQIHAEINFYKHKINTSTNETKPIY